MISRFGFLRSCPTGEFLFHHLLREPRGDLRADDGQGKRKEKIRRRTPWHAMIMDNVLSVYGVPAWKWSTGRARGPDITSYVMMRKRPITTLLRQPRYINISACTNADDYVDARTHAREDRRDISCSRAHICRRDGNWKDYTYKGIGRAADWHVVTRINWSAYNVSPTPVIAPISFIALDSTAAIRLHIWFLSFDLFTVSN